MTTPGGSGVRQGLAGIRYEAAASVARITLAEPDAGNPLNAPALAALSEALRKAQADPSIRAVVLAAEGDHFCCGMDLSAALTAGLDGGIDSLRGFANTLLLIRRCRLPVIACVEGKATGGGVGLVAACDIVLAASTASFILPEVIVGMVPALITPFLLRRVTPGRLAALTVSSRTISALEARELGLVDEAARDDLPGVLARQLSRIGRSAPEAIAASKRSIDDIDGRDLDGQVEAACTLQFERLQRADVREGVQQLAEGFAPSWFRRIGNA